MAFADTQKLVVELALAGNFQRQIKAAQTGVQKLGGEITKADSKAFQFGQHIGTGIKNIAKLATVGLGVLGANVVIGLRSLEDLEDAMVQTEAVIKSTGKAAGVSAEEVRNLAEKYEALNATVGDETIQEAENLLLTFTNIRKEAFEPTLEAALNMNKALGKDEDGLTDTMRILGKALNDPAKGLTALQRLGIRLTDEQKKLIDSALEVNDTYAAQQVILDELDKRFGGSFLAGGGTTRGKVAKFRDSIEDIQRLLATAMLPTVGKVADKLSEFLADPKIAKAAEDLGESIAGLFSDENLEAGADILKSVFETARAAAPVVAAAAKTMAGIVSTAVGVFRSLPPEIQQLAIGAFAINKLTGGIVTNLAGGLISSVLKQLVSGVVNVNGAVVNVNGAAGLGGGLPGGGGPSGGGVKGAIAGAAKTAAIVVPPLVIAAELQPEINRAILGDNVLTNPDRWLPPAPDPKPFWELMFRETPKVNNHLQSVLAQSTDLLRSNERQESIAAQKAEEVKAQIAAGDTRTELAITGSKTAITSSLTSVRAEIERKKLAVNVSVPVTTNVSVRETIYKTTTYKKYFTYAS